MLFMLKYVCTISTFHKCYSNCACQISNFFSSAYDFATYLVFMYDGLASLQFRPTPSYWFNLYWFLSNTKKMTTKKKRRCYNILYNTTYSLHRPKKLCKKFSFQKNRSFHPSYICSPIRSEAENL